MDVSGKDVYEVHSLPTDLNKKKLFVAPLLYCVEEVLHLFLSPASLKGIPGQVGNRSTLLHLNNALLLLKSFSTSTAEK